MKSNSRGRSHRNYEILMALFFTLSVIVPANASSVYDVTEGYFPGSVDASNIQYLAPTTYFTTKGKKLLIRQSVVYDYPVNYGWYYESIVCGGTIPGLKFHLHEYTWLWEPRIELSGLGTKTIDEGYGAAGRNARVWAEWTPTRATGKHPLILRTQSLRTCNATEDLSDGCTGADTTIEWACGSRTDPPANINIVVADIEIDSLEITQSIQLHMTPEFLKSHLENNEHNTPVRLVANKEGVIRIYPKDVPIEQNVTVAAQLIPLDVDVKPADIKPVTLKLAPGCTPQMRRDGVDPNCASFDLQFTKDHLQEGRNALWVGLYYSHEGSDILSGSEDRPLCNTVSYGDPLGICRDFYDEYGYQPSRDPDGTRHGDSITGYWLRTEEGSGDKIISHALVEEHKFIINAHKTDKVVIHGVGVCDAAGSCGFANQLPLMARLFKKIAPTAPSPHIHLTLHRIDSVHASAGSLNPPDIDLDDCFDAANNSVPPRGDYDRRICEPNAWFKWAAYELEKLKKKNLPADPPDEIHFYYGVVDPGVAGGSLGAASGVPGRAAVSRSSINRSWPRPWQAFPQRERNVGVMAHEMGHCLGLLHTNKLNPLLGLINGNPVGCYGLAEQPGTDYPSEYPDNLLWSDRGIKEVGYDIKRNKTRPGDINLPRGSLELMSYCYPRWVTPFSYDKMLEYLIPSAFERLYREARYMLLSGDAETGSIEAIFTFETLGPADEGVGNYRIEVQDASGGVLFTRYFTPSVSVAQTSDGEDEGPPFFSEMVPEQPGATQIVVYDATGTELNSVVLGGTPPSVSFIGLNPGESLSGIQTIEWVVEDPDSTQHRFWLEYSGDGGSHWHTLTTGRSDPSIEVNFDELPGSNGEALFRVYASDGVNTGAALSAFFSVPKKTPIAGILFPEGGSIFHVGDLISLDGFGYDPEDGTLTGDSLQWEIPTIGFTGSGNSLMTSYLEVEDIGSHTITLTARDSDGNDAIYNVTIEIMPAILGDYPDDTLPIPNLYYMDRDLDGFGDPQMRVSVLGSAPDGYITDRSDCDDNRSFINPEMSEKCNGLDDDCDGVVDEGDVCITDGREIPDITGSWNTIHEYTDNNCAQPDTLDDPGILEFSRSGNNFTAGPFRGMINNTVAYLDMSYFEENGVIYENCNGRLLQESHTMIFECDWTYLDPDPSKICSGKDRYVATMIDKDGDGFTPLDNDCNDYYAAVNPNGTEIPNNGIDDDCSGGDFVDPLIDGDHDGYTPARGDCDDYNPDIYPGASEIPNNNIDEDCDGADLVDSTLLDADGDGYTPAEGDCDDTNPNIYPEAPDTPNNGIDENCDSADASLTNPDWYITIWNSGYSDWMISPHGHEQLSGEWAAAVLYDGIANGEAMWLEPSWICPDWTSNSRFQVVTPFQTWDDPNNPVVGHDTGVGVISNGEVEITIEGFMRDGRTIAGLSSVVDSLDRILSHRYVMLQTYRIRNISSWILNNVALFQMMHAQPNDDYGPDNYGVYDLTAYADINDGFSEYHYDMTFFGSDVNWSESRDDIVGFSSTAQPNSWALGEFASDGCGGGEPGTTSLHHAVEANNLSSGSVIGPVEVAGAMRWDLGNLEPGQEVQHTVLFFTGHSPAGIPPSPGLILLEPELAINNIGTSHTITATVTLGGESVPGVDLVLEVISGPHETLTARAVTDPAGTAVFSYEGINIGTDQIRVSGVIDGDPAVEISKLATKEWIAEDEDACPEDPNKTEPGVCGCGVADTDSDNDGTADCIEECDNDPNKTEPGLCGCGFVDTDTDNDETPDCNDGCPNDSNKTEPGICGCGVSDVDSDLDGTADCNDGCPNDPDKMEPGTCGCSEADTDSDVDGIPDCNDGCPSDPNKVEPGICGCGMADTDNDADGTTDCKDGCLNDPNKTDPGICGCSVADTDTDGDGTADCLDGCPNDPSKIESGVCGCSIADTDTDNDGTPDCNDACPADPNKTEPGVCGCGVADTDSDNDGAADCIEQCDNDSNKTEPGLCGCGVADTDSDGDSIADCIDNCPGTTAGTEVDAEGCPINQTSACDVNKDGIVDINDIRIIGANRGTTNPDYDIDGDGVVTTNDARQCVLKCDNPRCTP